MKKLTILICALIPALNTFAYGGYGYSDYFQEMYDLARFSHYLMIAFFIIAIIFLVRWWKMTKNVEEIRQHLTHANPKLTYLVAIDEKEQAEKAALTMLVDLLFPIYSDRYNHTKAASMNNAIAPLLPKIAKLGLSVPEYVTSGEKFIDYINNLTGGKVPY